MSVISTQSASLLGPGKGESLYFSLLAGNCGPWLAAGLLPAETQIALLRVLQERELERVGGKGQSRAAAQNSDAATTLA